MLRLKSYMRLKNSNYSIYILLIISISLFNACSPKLRYSISSFLFDGVPNPYAVTVTPLKDSLPTLNEGNIVKTIIPQFTIHPPYKEKKCKECHNEGYGSRLKKPLPALCYQCHKPFDKTYTVVHGPVASGNCTQCHNPHKTKLKNLLKRSGQKLCLTCHTATSVLQDPIHKNIGDTNCTKCHNPHGGADKFNLQPNSCYNCHDNFKKKFNFLHGPVASFNCSQCHDTHKSKAENKLFKKGRVLCFSCHESKNVLTKEYHLKINNEECTKCHNPHGGANSKFLKTGY